MRSGGKVSPGNECTKYVQRLGERIYLLILKELAMVEAAGIEPASEKANCLKPTCVADSVCSETP